MKKSEVDSKKRIYILYLLVICIVPLIFIMFGVGKMNGIFFPPDEFGYWDNAAGLLGYNWDDVASRQSFYAYGYSLFLVPIMAVFNDPITMYRVAILLNLLFIIGNGLLLPLVIREIFPDISVRERTAVCIPAALYVGNLVYMHYTIAECLLFLCFTINSFFIAKYINKQRKIHAILALTFSFFMIVVHYRTFFVFIMTAFVILYIKFQGLKILDKDHNEQISGIENVKIEAQGNNASIKKLLAVFQKKSVLYLALGLLFLIIILYVIAKELDESHVLYIRDQLFRLSRLFNIKDLLSIIIGFWGKVFYIIVASFGLLTCVLMYYKKEGFKNLFGVYFIGSFIGSLIVSSVFFVGGLRFDYLIYGRYTEYFIPLIIVIGLICIKEIGINRKQIIINLLFVISVSLIICAYCKIMGIINYQSDFIPMLSWALSGKNIEYVKFFLKIDMAFIAFGLFISYLYYLGTCFKMRYGDGLYRDRNDNLLIRGANLENDSLSSVEDNLESDSLLCSGAKPENDRHFGSEKTASFSQMKIYTLALCISLVFIMITTIDVSKQVYPCHEADKGDIAIFEEIKQLQAQGRTLYFLDSPWTKYVDLLQFYLNDQTIVITEGLSYEAYHLPPDAVVLTYQKYEKWGRLNARYKTLMKSEHFALRYNE